MWAEGTEQVYPWRKDLGGAVIFGFNSAFPTPWLMAYGEVDTPQLEHAPPAPAPSVGIIEDHPAEPKSCLTISTSDPPTPAPDDLIDILDQMFVHTLKPKVKATATASAKKQPKVAASAKGQPIPKATALQPAEITAIVA